MSESSLRELNLKTTWWPHREPFADEVLIPALKAADEFRCMAGYFSSGILRLLAPGLADYIADSDNKTIRLLVSPNISAEDREALEQGLKDEQSIAAEKLLAVFDNPELLEDKLANHTRECLSYLISQERLEIKIVFPDNGALFHPKEWILSQDDDTVLLSGSSNFTEAGAVKNHEKMNVYRSWVDDTSQDQCDESAAAFENYWSNAESSSSTVSLPGAVEKRLINSAPLQAPTRIDYLLARSVAEEENPTPVVNQARGMTIPSWLNYEEGDYAHQGEAIRAWETNDRQGIFAIATGGGKTLTSLVAAARLQEDKGKLLIIIGVPTNPLFAQWCEEIQEFGLEAAFGSGLSKEAKLEQVQKAINALFFGQSDAEAVVCTQDFLATPRFQQLLQQVQNSIPQLLILDEVHNFGVPTFLRKMPDWIPYRLGLSATPTRQYDEDGTEEIFQFFGNHEEPVYEFSLDDAIGKCLTEYDYFLHPTELDDDELQEWVELSFKISQRVAIAGGDNDDEQLQLLYNKRRKIIETAASKVAFLENLLNQKTQDELSHSLIYLTAKDPEQINQVHDVLGRLGHTYHQVTEKETAQARVLDGVITAFREGHLTFITAKKVLDEGFNMPEIRRAYILASETTEKQWVQRRGRVLRQCEGKSHAEIHDFIVLPPSDVGANRDTRKLVAGELKRCEEFARLARNRTAADGPEQVLGAIRIEYS